MILRDPIQRMISAYYHMVKSSYLPPLDINEGLALLLDEQSGYRDKYKRAMSLLEYGEYGAGIRNYLRSFDKSKILILFTEDLLSDRDNVSNKIFHFLEVTPIYPKLSTTARPMHAVYNNTRLQFWYKLSCRFCSFNKNKTRGYGPSSVLNKLIMKLFYYFDMFILSKIFTDKKPTINNVIKQKLRHHYHDEITYLESFCKRDLSHWM